MMFSLVQVLPVRLAPRVQLVFQAALELREFPVHQALVRLVRLARLEVPAFQVDRVLQVLPVGLDFRARLERRDSDFQVCTSTLFLVFAVC